MSMFVHSKKDFNELYTYLVIALNMEEHTARLYTNHLRSLELSAHQVRYKENHDESYSDYSPSISERLLSNVDTICLLDSIGYQSSESQELEEKSSHTLDLLRKLIFNKFDLDESIRESDAYDESDKW